MQHLGVGVVLGRLHQGCPTAGVAHVRVGSRGQKQACRAGVAVVGGGHERGPALVVAGGQLGAGVEQQPHHLGIRVAGGSSEQSGASAVVGSVDRGARFQQRPMHGSARVEPAGVQQRGTAGAVGAPHVRAGRDQGPHHGGIRGVSGREHERGLAAVSRRHRQSAAALQLLDPVRHVVMPGDVKKRCQRGRAARAHGGSGVEQDLYRSGIRVERRREHERAPAVYVSHSHVCAGVDQRLNHLGVGVEGGRQHQRRNAAAVLDRERPARGHPRTYVGHRQAGSRFLERRRCGGLPGGQQFEQAARRRLGARCLQAGYRQQRGHARQDDTPDHGGTVTGVQRRHNRRHPAISTYLEAP